MSEFVLNPAYPEAVYAGVLGKVIGVYVGRPFEGWTHERILSELGEIDRYVATELGVPLVVTDDDISGTFTFLRALSDHKDSPELTPQQIGDTWLNYIIENRTILWWGGIGMSTEHTAFLRLKSGVQAPASGSIALNSRTVAEQIGAQIFIDGWGLIHPGEPEQAADFARRAASVSHDGEAIYGAQIVAALVAAAFVEKDISKLLDTAVALIPSDSIIASIIADVRAWHRDGLSWKEAFLELKSHHGYDRYPGNCHILPNHGVVILSLVYGNGNFSQSLMIANTCGWDTDCNSANVGCIVGVLSGLGGINAGYDWRGPVNDRLYLPTADGGRCLTDSVRETIEIIRLAHALRGLPYEPPKQGKRFHFSFPGSRQGFVANGARLAHIDRSLTIELLDTSANVHTATFPSEEERMMPGYSLVCSPTLHPGQKVSARIITHENPVRAAVVVGTLMGDDQAHQIFGQWIDISPRSTAICEFTVPEVNGYPITNVGIEIQGDVGHTCQLDWLDWEGVPQVTLAKTSGGQVWKHAWVSAVDDFHAWVTPPSISQNAGTGLLIYGCREWTDIAVEAQLTLNVFVEAGLAVRVQGLQRYYGLKLTADGRLQITKKNSLIQVLAEVAYEASFDSTHHFRFEAIGARLRGIVDGTVAIETVDEMNPHENGAVALLITEGRLGFEAVRLTPAI